MWALRKASGLGHAAAQTLIGAPGPPCAVTTLTTPEQRGDTIRYAALLARAESFGLEIEIRVRRKAVKP